MIILIIMSEFRLSEHLQDLEKIRVAVAMAAGHLLLLLLFLVVSLRKVRLVVVVPLSPI